MGTAYPYLQEYEMGGDMRNLSIKFKIFKKTKNKKKKKTANVWPRFLILNVISALEGTLLRFICSR